MAPRLVGDVRLLAVGGSRLCVNLCAHLHELLRLFFHAFPDPFFFADTLFGGVFADDFGGFHLLWRSFTN